MTTRTLSWWLSMAVAVSLALLAAACGGKNCVVPAMECGRPQCVEEGESGGGGLCSKVTTDKCYSYAVCEEQSDGRCGWTETDEFRACFDNPSSY